MTATHDCRSWLIRPSIAALRAGFDNRVSNMPLLFRCLRQFRRGMQGTWPSKDAARSTAEGCAAAQLARRSASTASTTPEGSQPGSTQVRFQSTAACLHVCQVKPPVRC